MAMLFLFVLLVLVLALVLLLNAMCRQQRHLLHWRGSWYAAGGSYHDLCACCSCGWARRRHSTTQRPALMHTWFRCDALGTSLHSSRAKLGEFRGVDMGCGSPTPRLIPVNTHNTRTWICRTVSVTQQPGARVWMGIVKRQRHHRTQDGLGLAAVCLRVCVCRSWTSRKYTSVY